MKYNNFIGNILYGLMLIASLVISTYLSRIYGDISEHLPKLDSLMRFALPIYLAMLPVIIAAATFLYQIYYNRYSLKKYRQALKSELLWLFTLLGIELLLLSAFWVLKESNPFLFFESVLVLFILLLKFFIFLKRFDRYSVGGFVQDYTQKCIEAIQPKKFNQKKVLRIMSEILQYFSESIERKESYYTEMTIKSKSKIFRSYVCNLNELRLNGSIDTKRNEEIIDAFVDSVHNDYKAMIDNACSMRTIGLYSYEIAKILKSAIKCQNMTIFTKFIEEIQRCFTFINTEDTGFLNEILEIAHEYALDENASEYATKIEDYSLRILQFIGYKKSCSKIKIRLMISCEKFMQCNIKKGIETETFFDNFLKSIKQDIKSFDRSEIECSYWVISKIYDLSEEKKNKKLFGFILENAYSITKKAMVAKCDFAVQLFSVLLSKMIESDMINDDDEADEKMLNCFLNCINYCPREALLYLPDYSEKLKKNHNEQECRKIQDAFSEIIQRLIVSKDDTILYECFDSLNECFEYFSMQDRKCQEILISIYEYGLTKNIKSGNSDSLFTVMNRFDHLLKKLNSDNKISQHLLDRIFEIFDRVGEKIMETTDYSAQGTFIDYVTKLSDIFPIINKEKKLKSRIIEMIFHYIVSVLQYKNEKSLKICSNALGWFAIDMEKCGDIARYEEAISYAVHMYELAYEQEFDKSTQVFLGTLFIILGAYATAKKENAFVAKLKNKIEGMKNNSVLKLSKRLRYYEAMYWDQTLGNDAKKNMNDFFNDLKLDKEVHAA